jgi:hypothetical protein
MKNNNLSYKTSDLSFAAYLSMKGLKLLKAKKSDDGRFEFELSDPLDESNALLVEYLNSECNEFDNHIRKIKKFLYSK